MKKFTLSLFASLALYSAVNAQVICTVTTALAYGPAMPGVTGFTLNTIARNSAALECSTPNCNSFVTTGLTTTLTAGSTYTIRINHTDDPSIGPNMNLRVWINYNHNNVMNDAGETVLSVDNHAPGVYIATFMVPGTALAGITKMRVTAKMPAAAGHTLPTPCDSPADPLGYHGEIEDYSVFIVSSASVNELSSANIFAASVFPNPTTNDLNISFGTKENSDVKIQLFDITGKLVNNLMENQNLKADNYNVKYDLNSIAPSSGIYFVKISAGNSSSFHKIVKVN